MSAAITGEVVKPSHKNNDSAVSKRISQTYIGDLFIIDAQRCVINYFKNMLLQHERFITTQGYTKLPKMTVCNHTGEKQKN